jgi:hypothetical protein
MMLTAAGSGWCWTAAPWVIRAALASVQSFGVVGARRLATTPVQLAALADAEAIVRRRA